MDETIAGWSPADLRRFVVNTILTDPGALPKDKRLANLEKLAVLLNNTNLGRAEMRFIPTATYAFPANDASGNSAATINLGITWSQHLAFFPTYFWPLGHWNWNPKLSKVNDNSSGEVMINNAGGAQSFDVAALSIGIP